MLKKLWGKNKKKSVDDDSEGRSKASHSRKSEDTGRKNGNARAPAGKLRNSLPPALPSRQGTLQNVLEGVPVEEDAQSFSVPKTTGQEGCRRASPPVLPTRQNTLHSLNVSGSLSSVVSKSDGTTTLASISETKNEDVRAAPTMPSRKGSMMNVNNALQQSPKSSSQAEGAVVSGKSGRTNQGGKAPPVVPSRKVSMMDMDSILQKSSVSGNNEKEEDEVIPPIKPSRKESIGVDSSLLSAASGKIENSKYQSKETNLASGVNIVKKTLLEAPAVPARQVSLPEIEDMIDVPEEIACLEAQRVSMLNMGESILYYEDEDAKNVMPARPARKERQMDLEELISEDKSIDEDTDEDTPPQKPRRHSSHIDLLGEEEQSISTQSMVRRRRSLPAWEQSKLDTQPKMPEKRSSSHSPRGRNKGEKVDRLWFVKLMNDSSSRLTKELEEELPFHEHPLGRLALVSDSI